MEKTMTNSGNVVVQTVSQAEIEKIETETLPAWSQEEEKRLVRKIDRQYVFPYNLTRLMTLLTDNG